MGEILKPANKPENMCLAPWTHSYISPQTERRLCCASREPAQSFKQYIDTEAGSGVYTPMTMDEWWNSEHVKSVRRRMMAGEELPECQVCDKKLLNVHVYRDYFWHLFKHHYDKIWESTDESGHTTLNPISWDYRISNLCNFKCRMCGDMLSSSWETEEKQHNQILLDNPKNLWMRKDIRKQITDFQKTVVAKELEDAIEEHRVEEIYWVGGEPLMFEEHWKFMSRIIELGDGPNVYARYNTNLSRTTFSNVDLYMGILANLRDWQVCASIDGTGKIGEYIRSGLVYNVFLENYKKGCEIQRNPRQMRLDFTLTLPGMFEIENMVELAEETGTDILAKVVFSFTPDIVLSPLALPKEILHSWIDETILKLNGRRAASPIVDVLLQLKERPTFAEQWPNEYVNGLRKGKHRILKLETIRNDSFTMRDILSNKQELLQWWNDIHV
jgi:MoaA/NifB/PqqE/SkfB family radical SAM enzyme